MANVSKPGSAVIGVYAGSFDPLTNGHVDLLKAVFGLCDRLVVAVGVHSAKKPMLTAQDRLQLTVRFHHRGASPQLQVDADRGRMSQLGLTQRDVTNALATSLAGTSQTAPNFWLNPKNGVSYFMTAQTPEYKLSSLQALQNLPEAKGITEQLNVVLKLAKQLDDIVDRLTGLLREHFAPATQ